MPPQQIGWFASLVGWFGARFIYLLIWIFGRKHRPQDVRWLVGPLGGPVIGDATYREVCAAEGLKIERQVRDGGLIPNFTQLHSAAFDPEKVHPLIREFYEHTTNFAMDVWSQTYFPAKVALWLLVKTISRQVNQLNFPLSPLDTARGIASEIILMRYPDGPDGSIGTVRYTGWFRKFAHNDTVLYTGFYMTEQSPTLAAPCMKVVFPMPNGNATVFLKPEVLPDGTFILDSSGKHFGDAGFYRVQAARNNWLRVWHIKSLKESFRMYVDNSGVLRCDHDIRFLGFRAVSLHYKLVKQNEKMSLSPAPSER